jgi:hypothetical protein
MCHFSHALHSTGHCTVCGHVWNKFGGAICAAQANCSKVSSKMSDLALEPEPCTAAAILIELTQ